MNIGELTVYDPGGACLFVWLQQLARARFLTASMLIAVLETCERKTVDCPQAVPES